MILRKNTIERILNLVKDGYNILIVGEFGSGKTYILRYLNKVLQNSIYFEFPYFYKAELERIFCKTFENLKEAMEYLIKSKYKYILIDNAHLLNKYSFSIVKELCKYHILVLASEKDISHKLPRDFVVIKLEKLKYEEVKDFIINYVKNEKVAKEIYEKSNGNLYLIIKLIKLYRKTGKLEEINEFKIKVDRKAIIATSLVLGTFLLAFRYTFLRTGFLFYYVLFSSLAYFLLFLGRALRYVEWD